MNIRDRLEKILNHEEHRAMGDGRQALRYIEEKRI
ncbi:MAG: hypothetical protein ACI9LX_004056 [Paraglaciecola sp.]|jgi:hypothetical protein